MAPFRERVRELGERRGHLCVGVDPRPGSFPPDYREAEGLTRWCLDLVEATEPHAAAYKPNLAFFLALGVQGIEALEATVDAVRETGAMSVLDGKFADIGSTAAAYADFAGEVVGADAVTVNPYMGTDVLDPFLDRDLDVFVLARTTNESARQIQTTVAGTVIQRFGVREVGFVAPGNDPDQTRDVRQTAGDAPLLLPGIGAQGGSAGETARAARNGPFLINVSRAIAQAEGPFPSSAAQAAEGFAREIEKAVGYSASG